MALKFPETLIGKNRVEVMSKSESWEARDTTTELRAHEQVHARAVSIFEALDKAGMDAWLNPQGNQVDSTYEPQYQLTGRAGRTYIGGEEIKELGLITKTNHQNFYIADIGLVRFLHNEDENECSAKGVSLFPDSLRGPEQMAISSKTEAFQFIDDVLEGLEKQAVDLGVLATHDQTEVSPVTA